VRGKRDENKGRERFWEMKGTQMGKVTGVTKKEEEEAAEAAEALRKQAGDRPDEDEDGVNSDGEFDHKVGRNPKP
jgi:pre-mRNA-splicing factor ATP-dependent RNA helicase DHX38/PRP16